MRMPFDLTSKPHNFAENARIKFVYTSPELHQNIEISLDGDDTTVETLLEAFERFLGALGLPLPENAAIAVIELEEEEKESWKEDEDPEEN